MKRVECFAIQNGSCSVVVVLEVPRFRPNLVVASPEEKKRFIENDWVGQTLGIGDEVRLNITGSCGRCVMTTLAREASQGRRDLTHSRPPQSWPCWSLCLSSAGRYHYVVGIRFD